MGMDPNTGIFHQLASEEEADRLRELGEFVARVGEHVTVKDREFIVERITDELLTLRPVRQRRVAQDPMPSVRVPFKPLTTADGLARRVLAEHEAQGEIGRALPRIETILAWHIVKLADAKLAADAAIRAFSMARDSATRKDMDLKWDVYKDVETELIALAKEET